MDKFKTQIADMIELAFNRWLKVEVDGKRILLNSNIDLVIELIGGFYNLFTPYGTQTKHKIKVSLSASKKQDKVLEFLEISVPMLISDILNASGIDEKEKRNILLEKIKEYINQIDTQLGSIWDLPLFDEPKKLIKDEVARARYKPSGIKGVYTCGKCGSKDVFAQEKQTRGCDEPMTTFFECVMCDHKWRVG